MFTSSVVLVLIALTLLAEISHFFSSPTLSSSLITGPALLPNPASSISAIHSSSSSGSSQARPDVADDDVVVLLLPPPGDSVTSAARAHIWATGYRKAPVRATRSATPTTQPPPTGPSDTGMGPPRRATSLVGDAMISEYLSSGISQYLFNCMYCCRPTCSGWGRGPTFRPAPVALPTPPRSAGSFHVNIM